MKTSLASQSFRLFLNLLTCPYSSSSCCCRTSRNWHSVCETDAALVPPSPECVPQTSSGGSLGPRKTKSERAEEIDPLGKVLRQRHIELGGLIKREYTTEGGFCLLLYFFFFLPDSDCPSRCVSATSSATNHTQPKPPPSRLPQIDKQVSPAVDGWHSSLLFFWPSPITFSSFFFLNLLSSLQSSLILITSKPSTRNWNMSLADILFLLILFFVDQHHQQHWCWSSVVSVCLPNYTLLIFLFIFVVVCRIPSSRWIEIYEKHDGNARSNVNCTCNSHFPRPCRVSLPRRNNDVIQNPGHADLVLPDRLWTI